MKNTKQLITIITKGLNKNTSETMQTNRLTSFFPASVSLKMKGFEMKFKIKAYLNVDRKTFRQKIFVK